MKLRSDITPGDIVRINYHAYRITSVEGDPAPGQTFTIRAHQLSGEKAGRTVVMTVPARATITYLDEHFPVCHQCGEVPPCRESKRARAAEEAAKRMETRMSIPDGWCMACSEPITRRQRTHDFPGPNIWNPLGTDDVRFHARQDCRSAAAQYENDWVNADHTRQRSLLTLKCPGTITVHGDGTAECNHSPSCPHIYAHHTHYTSCYSLSPCPRGCTPDNHPGATPARNLAPNGTYPLQYPYPPH